MRVLLSPPFSAHDANPYLHLLASALRSTGVDVEPFSRPRAVMGRYDVLHLHWPENALLVPGLGALRACASMFARILTARVRGTRIVWTAHNIRPHEPTPSALSRLFWAGFTPLVDGVLVLSEAGGRELMRERPGLGRKIVGVTPHGHYRGVYRNDITPAEARARIGIPPHSPTAVFFGRIRPYKNVPLLIQRFRQMDDPEARLVVVGRCDAASSERAIKRMALEDPRIHLILDTVPADDVQIYMNAADLVVLPFAEILNSGSAILSLGFNRRVLAPKKGALLDLHRYVGAQWITLYQGELSTEVLSLALHEASESGGSVRVCPLEGLAWEAVAEATLGAYKRVRFG
jgi:beta-1,4-mannosyltransferase